MREPLDIYQEITFGEKAQRQRIAAVEGIIQGYTSPFFRGEGGEIPENYERYNPENHTYAYLSFMVPSMAFSRPRTEVTSRMWGGEGDAETVRYALDAWMLDNRYERHAQKMATDMNIHSAVSLVTLVPHPYLPDVKTPRLARLSSKQFIRDPGGLSPEDCNWFAHKWIASKKDMLRRAEKNPDEGWHPDAIRNLPENDGVNDLRRNKVELPEERDEIILIEFWDQHAEPVDDENTPDKGYHGVIYTLAEDVSTNGERSMAFVRDPRDFYGPPEGPYSYTEVYFVPDDPYGLSPAIATEGQNRDLNLHARAMSESMRQYKRLIIAADTDTAQTIREAAHDWVISLPGADKSNVVPAEVGGITRQWLEYMNLAKERLERVSGLTEAQRGVVTEGSATAAAIADAASDTRTDFLKQRMHNHAEEELTKVAWYLHSSDEVETPISPALAKQLEIPLEPGEVPTIKGGSDVPFSMFSLDVEPMSMERSTEGIKQRRMMDMMGILGQLVPIASQIEWEGWGTLFSLLGEAFNIQGLSGIGPPPPQSQQVSTERARGSSAQIGVKDTGKSKLRGYSSGAELSASQKG